MLPPTLLSRLRGLPGWRRIRATRQRAGPRLADLAHRFVLRLGPVLPYQLRAKHRYDRRLLFVDPELIQWSIPVGNWRRGRTAALGRGRLGEVVRWFTHGAVWKSTARHLSSNLHGGFVLAGSWDSNPKRFGIRESVWQIFVEGVPPEATDEYRKMIAWVEAGDLRYTRGCRTRADVDAYFARMMTVFEAIRNHGYRTQRELGVPGDDEIRVCVDRVGRLCVFGGGTHRLSMVRVLELPSVPVIVKRVHADWVRTLRRKSGLDRERAVEWGIARLESSGRGAAAHLQDEVGRAS